MLALKGEKEHPLCCLIRFGAIKSCRSPTVRSTRWRGAHANANSYPLSIELASASSGIRLIMPQLSRAMRSSRR